jgi:hypothetical protein
VPTGSAALRFIDAQTFFQPGEGVFKGGGGLPVREIGDVIFADFFRQIFAGVNDARYLDKGAFGVSGALSFE